MMLLLGAGSAKASAYDDTSVAGLFPVSNQGREVWNFNPNWRFHLGDVLGAERADYDDTSWGVVSTPHSVKLEPAEASGCRNYQGIAWDRKTFIVPGNRSEIYFEAIMGKQKIYVNGKLAKEHFGGYLPVIVNLKEQGLKKGDKCVVAVMAPTSTDDVGEKYTPLALLKNTWPLAVRRPKIWLGLLSFTRLSVTDCALGCTKLMLAACPRLKLSQFSTAR